MNPQTRRVLDLFETISRIPRCSKNEEAVARWFQGWAGDRGWPAERDAAGNLRIAVPATLGCERAPGVVLQGHLDMVCEKTPDSGHDFTRDPIRIIRDGDWIRADGTTLGADNGAALALGAALAEDPSLRHPRMELLFTVDEETGLTGAKQLARGLLEGRVLINLDSETEGVFTVGCAGGRDTAIRRAVRLSPVPQRVEGMRIAVGGLCGGHSGIDIHRRRANAVKLLARMLAPLARENAARLLGLNGGTRHNAIPRDAAARIACAPEAAAGIAAATDGFLERFRAEFPAEDGLWVSAEAAPPPAAGSEAPSPEDAAAAIELLLALPHGVAELSPDFPGLVLTSNNLAVARLDGGGVSVLTSQRSMAQPALDAMSETVQAVAALAGAKTSAESEYPPWTPNLESALLERSRGLYRGLFGSEPQVRAIHAGLECALIGGVYPDMDMISLGPTTENAHSPSERLSVPSLSRLWDFLKALLGDLAAPG